MQVAAALLVDEVRKHPEGGVDLLGLFEDIYFDEVPVTLESISVFIDLALSDADKGIQHSLEFLLVDPQGNAQQEPTRIRFAVPPAREFPRDSAQLDMALFTLTFHSFGTYWIEVRDNGELLRRIPLYVHSKADQGEIPGTAGKQ